MLGLEGNVLLGAVLVLGLFLVLINVLAWLLMRTDKRRAGTGRPRISEARFMRLAALGAWPAIWLAMRRFRHKTKKRSFQLGIAVATAINILAIVLILSLEARA